MINKLNNVLSVGFFEKMEQVCVTIACNEGAVCYLLPNELLDWVINCVAFENKGVHLFTLDVEVGINNNKYYAEVL